MAKEQIPHTFICALLGEGVTPQQIESATTRTRNIKLSEDIGALAHPHHDGTLAMSFAAEQVRRMGL